MAFIDLINAFKAVVDQRFTFKTLPLSIKKTDSSNSFKDLADLLLLTKPTDENKIILFNQVQAYTINWKTDIVPGTTGITYIDLFGSYPKFTVAIFNADAPQMLNDISGPGISRNMNIDGISLDSIYFDLGPFLVNGVIIIN